MSIESKKYILNSYCPMCFEEATSKNKPILMLELQDGKGVCPVHGEIISDAGRMGIIDSNVNPIMSFEEFSEIINQDDGI